MPAPDDDPPAVDGNEPITCRGDIPSFARKDPQRDRPSSESPSAEQFLGTRLEQIFAELDAAGAADLIIERDLSPSPERDCFHDDL